jgi:hypothetical protein
MVAAFGVASEPEPSLLAISDSAISGVHLTRLRGDGSGKAGTDADKIMIGASSGSPIVLAPPGDSLGMCVTEGIEDALSVHAAIGLGAWAAGAANRMPALADAIPGYIDFVQEILNGVLWRTHGNDPRRHSLEGGIVGVFLLGRPHRHDTAVALGDCIVMSQIDWLLYASGKDDRPL